MFLVRVILSVKTDQVDEFKNVARECSEVGSKASGCRMFEISQFSTDQSKFLLYEEWQQRVEFDEYKKTGSFKEIGGKLMPFFAQPPKTYYFEAEVAEEH